MATTLRTTQIVQLHSFWNLIQTTDEDVQKELYMLMQRKFANSKMANDEYPSFLSMQGILKGNGNHASDRQLLDNYLSEKYNV